jgi:starch synthase
MKILFLASEVSPFSKTGGLGDVAGALPKAMARAGHQVWVVSPRYGSVDPARHGLRAMKERLLVGGETVGLWEAEPDGGLRQFLVEDPIFANRKGIYGEGGSDYPDSPERFSLLCRAGLALAERRRLEPEIVHLHDWQTALAAWLLREARKKGGPLSRARSVLTIHNLAYQGLFPLESAARIGLPREVLEPDAMESWGKLSLLKGGIVFADAITTVSPTYAREILTPEHGCGLEGLLAKRQKDLHGILNGIDVEVWNPASDPHLPARYRADDLGGKVACKKALQEELGLPVRPEVPLIGLVGRLAEQKGIDLVTTSLRELLGQELQLALLGSGQAEHEQTFQRVARELPQRCAVRIGFDEGLAHRIEAGADLFLMPSRFEPCGLNQMYSLRYGTIPVVRSVGGLADTVEDYDGQGGNGFRFQEYTPEAMMAAIRRALDVHRNGAAWRGLQARGMARDFSWDASAQRYEALFQALVDSQ